MRSLRILHARYAIITAIAEAADGTCRKLLSRQGIKGRRTDDAVCIKAMSPLIRTDGLFRTGAKNTVYIDAVTGIHQGLLNEEDFIVCRRFGNKG